MNLNLVILIDGLYYIVHHFSFKIILSNYDIIFILLG